MATGEVIRALFSTNADTAEVVMDIILSRPNDCATLFCICHDASIERQSHLPEEVSLRLCLPTKRVTKSQRCSEILPLRLPRQEALLFLRGTKPMDTASARRYLDRTKALRSLKPLVELLTLGNKNPQRDLYGAICWLRAKITSALRRMYRTNASARWFISTFGSREATFVLVTTAYYFHPSEASVETLIQLTELFVHPDQGQSLAAVTSCAELSQIFGTSQWTRDLDYFPAFTRKKLNKDTMEMCRVRAMINKYRGQLPLSDTGLVEYVYTAHAQCFNRVTFERYSVLTSAPHLSSALGVNGLLTRMLDSKFSEYMRTYFNKKSYLEKHVKIKLLKVKLCHPSVYTWDTDPCDGLLVAWSGLSRDVMAILMELANWNRETPHHGPNLHGMLSLASQKTSPGVPDPRDDLVEVKTLTTTTRCWPVFRCQFLEHHYFMTVAADNISQFWRKHIAIPENCNIPDIMLTRSLTYEPYYYTQNTLAEQSLVSRHEYFNHRLPVCNLVLDMDVKIVEMWSVTDIYQLCLAVRHASLQMLSRIGPVESDHPVYFFKSACPPPDCENMADILPFCICREKLGLRVITPLPRGYSIIGTRGMQGLVAVLSKLVSLSPRVRKLKHKLSSMESFFDAGIYSQGRCIRLPHTYKVDKSGVLTRQLRLFVCHPKVNDKRYYVENALNVQNLLHHSLHVGWPRPIHFCYHISDQGQGFITKKVKDALPAPSLNFAEKIETSTGLTLSQWVEAKVWPTIYTTLTSTIQDNRLAQFQRVTFEQTAANIVRVCHPRGKNFKCLRYQHRNIASSVRIFLVLHHTSGVTTVTFMSQCFSGRCGSNRPVAHFSTNVTWET
ncbi:ORF50 [callitrichine gammaherpesvirus 3]|uniref:ORF50 n=1 Tax=callitrichine gammaherpesvirus 3 TaxID=106331 RepID=Q993F9_9GAMA|nr:ORF50 [callitrichine gammaherpesvirus 3]AAK38259.2 ORF50 [callitrichine gammaherpesvirus 3]